MKSHLNTFQTKEAQDRIADILALLKEHGTLQSHKLAQLLHWPPSTLGTYLRHMQREKMIVADDEGKERGMFWSIPDEHGKPSVLPAPKPQAPQRATRNGRANVFRGKAEDFHAAVPVDPMSQFLYGSRTSQKEVA